MAMRQEWVVRSLTHGYLIDTCTGGVFTGREAFTWSDVEVINKALTWPSSKAALDALHAADLERSVDLDIFPIDL